MEILIEVMVVMVVICSYGGDGDGDGDDSHGDDGDSVERFLLSILFTMLAVSILHPQGIHCCERMMVRTAMMLTMIYLYRRFDHLPWQV